MALDSTDLKILSCLDTDARQTESAIAKQLKTSKQVIRYRLNRLEQKNIIQNYYTVLDVGQLGFDSYYIFLQLTGLNPNEEIELYKKIQSLPQIAWMVTGVGRWDVVLLFCAKSIDSFHKQLSQLKALFGNNLHELTYTTLIQAEHISYKFLDNKSDESLKTTPRNKILELTDTDKKILKKISLNGRMLVTDIANKTKIPLHSVHYALKNMKQNKVIQGFRPKININSLGKQWHLLLFKFKSTSLNKVNSMISYCKETDSVYYVTNTVGNYDLMIDVHVNSIEEFRKFLFDIKDNFADLILLYESIFVFDELLINYVPPIVLE